MPINIYEYLSNYLMLKLGSYTTALAVVFNQTIINSYNNTIILQFFSVNKKAKVYYKYTYMYLEYRKNFQPFRCLSNTA